LTTINTTLAVKLKRWCLRHSFSGWDKADAIHRAWGYTQFATGTVFAQNRVHESLSANDCIYRAGWQAQGTANALGFINDRN
jgi:hypothetical protein